MIFCEVEYLTGERASLILENALPESDGKNWEKLQALNANLVAEVPAFTTMICTGMGEKTFSFILATDLWDEGKTKVVAGIKRWIKNILGTSGKVSLKQITVDDFVTSIMLAELNDYLTTSSHRIKYSLDVDYFDNRQFHVEEHMIKDAPFSKKKAMEQAKKCLADKTLLDEIERIYADCNPRNFLGHPVHYRISCSSPESGMEMVDLLVNALHDRKRVGGCRINLAHDITPGCYDESDFSDFIAGAKGNVVVIDTRGLPDSAEEGRYASVYEEAIRYIDGVIRRYCNEVLFIFMEDSSNSGFSKALLAQTQEYLKIVGINEGIGDPSEALEYLNYLASESDLNSYWDMTGKDVSLQEKAYTATELRMIFQKWSNECLSKSVYSAYADYQQSCVKPPVTFSSNKLDELVGLTQVKNITKQIIATNVIAKRRMKTTFIEQSTSKHMIFTGNPGSAKTTVARILAKLLKEEGVLESGAFVECGRSDLVGKYVGWTAQIVKKKFKEARGGVLFIDEAYSLVDEGGQFGDEAINTIVQEMENYRDEVIVIFAGYPDRMRAFLDKNEGLRSRIAFHIEFPDYSADELIQIMDLMLDKRSYSLTESAREKALSLMKEGCSKKDFGNGRFVRNIVEQAIMKQSLRLYELLQSGKELTDEEMSLLIEEDLEVENLLPRDDNKHIVGFYCC